MSILLHLPTAIAQYRKKPPPKPGRPQSYADYYRGEIKRRTTPYGVRGGPTNPQKYVIDKYFYQRPSISPYLNLTRPNSSATSNYYSYMVPERERRQQATAKTAPSKRGAAAPSSKPTSSYYNRWYGGRPMIGLR